MSPIFIHIFSSSSVRTDFLNTAICGFLFILLRSPFRLLCLFFHLLCLTHGFSIVGYSSENLTCLKKIIEIFQLWMSKSKKKKQWNHNQTQIQRQSLILLPSPPPSSKPNTPIFFSPNGFKEEKATHIYFIWKIKLWKIMEKLWNNFISCQKALTQYLKRSGKANTCMDIFLKQN